MLPPNLIKEYLAAKFPVNKILGQEFTTNSIFASDSKLHLSINLETGLWQDFKSGESGNFPQLIAAVEQISYEQASAYIRSKLFDTPEKLFEVSSLYVQNQKSVGKNTVSDIFKSFQKFNPDKINKDNLTERLAQKFIKSRKLDRFSFYLSKTGRYTNRLIIPYSYDDDETVFYFQARNLSVIGVKYLNPSREVTGQKSSDILFPFKESCDYIFLTEGPLDAISMQLNGINATCTQGSRLSHAQAEMIRDKQIIFAYDNDEAGKLGISHARKLMLGKNKNDFCVAKLPDGVKDWNELHARCPSKEDFTAFVTQGLQVVDFEFDVIEGLS